MCVKSIATLFLIYNDLLDVYSLKGYVMDFMMELTMNFVMDFRRYRRSSAHRLRMMKMPMAAAGMRISTLLLAAEAPP